MKSVVVGGDYRALSGVTYDVCAGAGRRGRMAGAMAKDKAQFWVGHDTMQADALKCAPEQYG